MYCKFMGGGNHRRLCSIIENARWKSDTSMLDHGHPHNDDNTVERATVLHLFTRRELQVSTESMETQGWLTKRVTDVV